MLEKHIGQYTSNKKKVKISVRINQMHAWVRLSVTLYTVLIIYYRLLMFLVCGVEHEFVFLFHGRGVGVIVISQHFTVNHAMYVSSSTEQGGGITCSR